MLDRPRIGSAIAPACAALCLSFALAGCGSEPQSEPEPEPQSESRAAPGAEEPAASQSPAAQRIQHDNIGSDFPIARAIEVTPTTQMIWHSGVTPRPANPDAERNTPAYWGDTRAQTISVFDRMQESLDELGVSYDDIVKMTVFLVPDPNAGGRMDFGGFMQAYREYFGADAGRMNLPARSTVGVAQLVAPGMLVEIEAIFARPAE